MASLLAIAIGGAMGALTRYGTDKLFSIFMGENYWGTMASNLVGSFLLGMIVAGILNKTSTPHSIGLFLTVGFCGSFTTFSTLALTSVTMLEKGDHLNLIVNLIGSMTIGLCAAAGGIWIGRNILQP